MTTTTWATPEAIATALTTELNSLANAGITAASSAIDNLTGLYRYASFEVVLASLTPTAGAHVLIHLVASLDGTNYEDVSTANVFAVVAALAPSTSASAKRLIAKNVLIPPHLFKLAIENRTGVTLAAANNTLKYRRHAETTA